MKALALRFGGAFLGVFLGEMSSLPFMPWFERAVNQRAEISGGEFLVYMIARTVLFVGAIEVFRRGDPLTIRSGFRFGVVYAVVIATHHAIFLLTFTTHEPMYIVGVVETFLANYILAGVIAGVLEQRFGASRSTAQSREARA